MTECVYQRPITSFAVEMKPQPVFEVDILAEGRAALERANHDLGGSVTLSKLPLCLLFLFTVFSRVLMCCNLHPSFLSFPTSAGFCCSCEYTVSTYSCHMTLFINWLESQDSSGAAHYLTRACLLVSEVMWEQIFKKSRKKWSDVFSLTLRQKLHSCWCSQLHSYSEGVHENISSMYFVGRSCSAGELKW